MKLSKTLRNFLRRVSKKQAEEKLQDLRNHQHDKIRYKKRMQLEEEFDRYLEEELKRLDKE